MTHARHERLTRYAAAASVLSLGGIATAEVIHREVNHDIHRSHYDPSTTNDSLQTFLINPLTGVTSFIQQAQPQHSHQALSSQQFGFAQLIQRTNVNTYLNQWFGKAAGGLQTSHSSKTDFGLISALDYGDSISVNPYQTHAGIGLTRWANNNSSGAVVGLDFSLDEPQFMGFAIKNDAGVTCFGWAQFEFILQRNASNSPLQFTDIIGFRIHDYAYDDTGAAITAGQTESATAVPGAGGLLALACGAAGLRRRRNRATTTAETV